MLVLHAKPGTYNVGFQEVQKPGLDTSQLHVPAASLSKPPFSRL